MQGIQNLNVIASTVPNVLTERYGYPCSTVMYLSNVGAPWAVHAVVFTDFWSSLYHKFKWYLC